MSLTHRIKGEAARLGFSLTGVLPASPSLSMARYESWLEEGLAGEMEYLHRHSALKRDVRELLPEARSTIVVTLNYNRPPGLAPNYHVPDNPAPASLPASGRVSRFALGRDYHLVMAEKLRLLAAFIEQECGRMPAHRICVDSAPLLERELALRAGLGWIGKNGNLIHWRAGSWLFLGELLLDIELDYDNPAPPGKSAPQTKKAGAGVDGGLTGSYAATRPAPFPEPELEVRDSCGSCRACIEACPTGAIVAGKVVDSRRCISYLTIELKGPIPEQFRGKMGDWLFGCDICQEVCPWNRRAPQCDPRIFGSRGAAGRMDPVSLLKMEKSEFNEIFRHSPLKRAKRRGIARNAAIVLGNALRDTARKPTGNSPAAGSPQPERAGERNAERERIIEALTGALEDGEPLVRASAAWALGEGGVAGAAVPLKLKEALEREDEQWVRSEISSALKRIG